MVAEAAAEWKSESERQSELKSKISFNYAARAAAAAVAAASSATTTRTTSSAAVLPLLLLASLGNGGKDERWRQHFDAAKIKAADCLHNSGL